MPSPSLLSLEAHHPWPAVLSHSWVGGDGLLDASVCVLAVAAACLFWRQLRPLDLLALAALLAASVGAAHWRRLHPASYAAHREWVSASARVSLGSG
jgi:hypothetical protein